MQKPGNQIKRFVVFTTVNPPSEALRAWAKLEGSQTEGSNYLIGVADKKTPIDWHLENCHMISAWQQTEKGAGGEFAKTLPWNSYSRKMLGYRLAIETGAEVIIDTDDDNTPLPSWSFPDFESEQFVTSVKKEWFNAYRYFTNEEMWPRGFPLDKIRDSYSQDGRVGKRKTNVGVWQCLVNGDPDVDAIYRLTQHGPVTFQGNPPIVLERGVWCPFNSQNTVWRKEVFPLMYLPHTVSMRCTDIIRSLVALPIMNEKGGYQLGFTPANAFQIRNPHDYLVDFKDEIPIYLHAQRIISAVTNALHWKRSIEGNMCAAYLALLDEGIVQKDEMTSLAFWLKTFV
jgi:hypothetical protein